MRFPLAVTSNLKKYKYFQCTYCGAVLRREMDIRKISSFCAKKDDTVKVKKLSNRFIKKQLKNCGEDSDCGECFFMDINHERCIFFDDNHYEDIEETKKLGGTTYE